MIKIRFVLCSFIIILFGVGSIVHSEETFRGKEMKIFTADGDSLIGNLYSITTDSICLSNHLTYRSLTVDSVNSLYYKVDFLDRGEVAGGLIGSTIGLCLGLIYEATSKDGYGQDRHKDFSLLKPFFVSVAGCLAGIVFGSQTNDYRPIAMEELPDFKSGLNRRDIRYAGTDELTISLCFNIR